MSRRGPGGSLVPGPGVRPMGPALLLSAVFLVLGGRLFQVQVLQAAERGGRVDRLTTKERILAPNRGSLLDRTGVVLASSRTAERVAVDPANLRATLGRRGVSLGDFVEAAADLLEVSEAEVVERIAGTGHYRILAAEVTARQSASLRQLHRDWRLGMTMSFEPVHVRSYPQGREGAQLIGFFGAATRRDADGRTETSWEGRSGIERELEADLSGHPGSLGWTVVGSRVAGTGVFRPGRVHSASDGADVRLTVDRRINHAAAKALDAVQREFDPAWASIVMIDPRDGRILASHATPSFDPNRYESFFDPDHDVYSDPAVASLFTPGSVMKPFVLAAALQEGVVGVDEQIDCEGGRWMPPGRSQAIIDVHAFDRLPARDVVVESSNIGAAKIGLRLGPELLQGWLNRFELGSRTGIGSSAEVRAQIPSAERWRGREGTAWTVPSVSFGYQVALTPLRLAASFAPLVNGGWSVEPRAVESVENGARGPGTAERRRILDPQVAMAVRQALVDVCQRGTAARIVPEGLTMGGKTGTAVRLGRADGGYTATFVGFAPADAPRYLCVAVVDRPQGGRHFGSQVAAPAAAAVLEAAMALEAQ